MKREGRRLWVQGVGRTRDEEGEVRMVVERVWGIAEELGERGG